MDNIVLPKHCFGKRHKNIVSNQSDVLRKPLLGRALRQGDVDCVNGSRGWNIATKLDRPDTDRVASIQRCAVCERMEKNLPGASTDVCYLQVVLLQWYLQAQKAAEFFFE